ncbi:MAG: hypothetical protein AAFX87_00980 [Bacteroidota bacterium]
MTKEEVIQLVQGYDHLYPEADEVVETHISWVIFIGDLVYKLKKPIQYSFLDFSTLEKRKYYCEREVELNKRLTKGMYLGVVPVYSDVMLSNDPYSGDDDPIDYAVVMKKMDRTRQMNLMLTQNQVNKDHIKKLSKKVAHFHKMAKIITTPFNLDQAKDKFNDLLSVSHFLSGFGNQCATKIIDSAIRTSDEFLGDDIMLFVNRADGGFVRDCHGDLHAKNIFLYNDPVIFDCIEFNDSHRCIDVLDEIAFCAMDLEANGFPALSCLLFDSYANEMNCIQLQEDFKLFIYYKCYRANVRAKVNALRAKSASSESERIKHLSETYKYLDLMVHYMDQL